MIALSGAAPDLARAEECAADALASGAALHKLREMIAAQGGDARVVDDPGRLPAAPRRARLAAARDGVVQGLDAGAIGRAAVLLGAGRSRVDERVDPAVGVVVLRAPGERVRKGEAVLEMHYRHDRSLAEAMNVCAGAIAVADEPPPATRLVLCEVR
jgi:thymidine phosphorylase